MTDYKKVQKQSTTTPKTETIYSQNDNNPPATKPPSTERPPKLAHEAMLKEPLHASQRRQQWKKFGQAAVDEKLGIQRTVQSTHAVFLEPPGGSNCATHPQQETDDEIKAAFGNLDKFRKLQELRKLARQQGVELRDGKMPSTTTTSPAAANKLYVPPHARRGGTKTEKEGGGVSTNTPSSTKESKTIRVSNLSVATTEADLHELVQSFGRISRVHLAKDENTRQSRGFAYVSFLSRDCANKAMDHLQGHGYDYMILRLEWVHNDKDRGAFGKTDGGAAIRSGYGKALAQDTNSKVSYM